MLWLFFIPLVKSEQQDMLMGHKTDSGLGCYWLEKHVEFGLIRAGAGCREAKVSCNR